MANRKMYNTTLDADLMKKLKVLAAQMEVRQNDLLEEAIQDLLEKYKDAGKWDIEEKEVGEGGTEEDG